MKLSEHFIPLMAFIKAYSQAPGDRAPEDLSQEIDALINQARMAALARGIDLPRFQDALFPVLAWADEQVSRTRAWHNEHAWQQCLLQRRYFKTSLAGREFFDRLDGLEPKDVPLREIYLLCLCLGFEGRYSLTANSAELTNIRIEQYRLLQQQDPQLAASARELFPAAYDHGTQVGAKPHSLFRHLTLRRTLFILLPPLILLAVGAAMHADLTHAVQQFREAVNL